MANIQELWWNGKSLVVAPLIKTAAECSVVFPLSCFDMAPSAERVLISLLQFAKDSAYVINLAAHLTTSKQSGHFPVYCALKSCNAPLTDITMSAVGRGRVSLWTCVLVCVVHCCMTRPDSDVGAVIRSDYFRFGSHVYHSIWWQHHHPVLISCSFLEMLPFSSHHTFTLQRQVEM